MFNAEDLSEEEEHMNAEDAFSVQIEKNVTDSPEKPSLVNPGNSENLADFIEDQMKGVPDI